MISKKFFWHGGSSYQIWKNSSEELLDHKKLILWISESKKFLNHISTTYKFFWRGGSSYQIWKNSSEELFDPPKLILWSSESKKFLNHFLSRYKIFWRDGSFYPTVLQKNNRITFLWQGVLRDEFLHMWELSEWHPIHVSIS